ncbi:DUF5777 family beta-barrel protein [Tenacibaculum amylolyticum]|uniref:DUF5777 family beta-barrel protein n=1 Tax=Tenacibaculum amylolyticum TaxID=104269 RepID=UPI003892FA2D
MKTTNVLYTLLIFFCCVPILTAQDLLSKLDNEFPKEDLNTIATFKTTRIGLGHSIETRKQGTLEISMYNRYWNHKEGTTQSFLADEVNIRFGLDYAISDNVAIGVGYSTFDKITDGYLKYKFLHQKKNAKKSPFSMVLLQTISHRNNEDGSSNSIYGSVGSGSNIYSFATQLLIARKFTPKISAQLSPTFITRSKNFMNNDDSKNQFALGFGARYKVGGHVSIVSEYYAVLNPMNSVKTYNPFMIGVNWEVSNLLLQFHMTNARNFAEDTFIPQTTNNFNFHDGNFHFGFNATFVLDLNKNKL